MEKIKKLIKKMKVLDHVRVAWITLNLTALFIDRIAKGDLFIPLIILLAAQMIWYYLLRDIIKKQMNLAVFDYINERILSKNQADMKLLMKKGYFLYYKIVVVSEMDENQRKIIHLDVDALKLELERKIGSTVQIKLAYDYEELYTSCKNQNKLL
ncbi:MAG: hypothetical protein IJF24_00880 [Clostridia bacterium]|nr:hypothetical protein [Clostridia bacterium]